MEVERLVWVRPFQACAEGHTEGHGEPWKVLGGRVTYSEASSRKIALAALSRRDSRDKGRNRETSKVVAAESQARKKGDLV